MSDTFIIYVLHVTGISRSYTGIQQTIIIRCAASAATGNTTCPPNSSHTIGRPEEIICTFPHGRIISNISMWLSSLLYTHFQFDLWHTSDTYYIIKHYYYYISFYSVRLLKNHILDVLTPIYIFVWISRRSLTVPYAFWSFWSLLVIIYIYICAYYSICFKCSKFILEHSYGPRGFCLKKECVW